MAVMADTHVVSAPGKVILHGEHSVVYGKVALASSLNLRCFLHMTTPGDNHIVLDLPDVDIQHRWSLTSLKTELLPYLEFRHDGDGFPSVPCEETLQRLKQFANVDIECVETRHLAVISFLYLYCCICTGEQNGRVLPPVHVRLMSQLPVGAGLGSSAAFSVCLAASLLHKAGWTSPPRLCQLGQHGDSNLNPRPTARWSDTDLQLINKWAFLGEKIVHGRPSGIDNSVSTLGGAVCFQNKQITPVHKMPRLKILLTNTRVPRSTKTLVANVKTRHEKFPEVMDPILTALDGLAERSIQIYSHLYDQPDSVQDYSELEELIDMNQHLLNTIGVGHRSLDSIVRLTAHHGLHTKLTGAGGGGCAYTLLRPDTPTAAISAASADLCQSNFDCWETCVGAVGVAYHPEPHLDTTIPPRLFQCNSGDMN